MGATVRIKNVETGFERTLVTDENGRSFIELATLTAGVQIAQSGGRGSSTGFGTKLFVNGSRYMANLFTLDGTQVNDQFNQAGSASGNIMGVEAVREFQVLTDAFSAEYGRHTGAVINAVTKTGSNQFHGSVFEFIRNDNLDARNFFDRGGTPEFKRNQFGASAAADNVYDLQPRYRNYRHIRTGRLRRDVHQSQVPRL